MKRPTRLAKMPSRGLDVVAVAVSAPNRLLQTQENKIDTEISCPRPLVLDVRPRCKRFTTYCSAAFCSTSAFTTTCVPGWIPEWCSLRVHPPSIFPAGHLHRFNRPPAIGVYTQSRS